MIAAEQYASRLVVPQSQRSHPNDWASHKDHAAKALKKLAGPHLPGSLRQLESLVAPHRLDEEPLSDQAVHTLLSSGVRLGLGDGDGMNFVATDLDLARRLGLSV